MSLNADQGTASALLDLAALPESVVLRLERWRKVVGVVVDREGHPVPGAKIQKSGGGYFGDRNADARGGPGL